MNGQIYSESFDNGMPADFTLINNDGLVPNANVNFVNDAWVVTDYTNVGGATSDSVAVSNSWYDPAGQADDWMITPAITLTTSNILRWEAEAVDPDFPDGYEVLISTTGTAMADFMANPALFTIASEDAAPTARIVDLSAYDGQTVHIAFRNNSSDQFLLIIDDIIVEEAAANDAQVLSASPLNTEYTIMPLVHSAPFVFQADVFNGGSADMTNTTLTVNLYDESGAVVYNAASAGGVTVAPFANQALGVSGYSPTAVGTYLAEYIVSIDEADSDATNDTLYNAIIVSDTAYARDNGNITGSLGIGSGPGQNAILGQNFTLLANDDLTSVSFFLNGPAAGDSTRVSIYTTNFTGTPDVMITSSETYYTTDADTSGVFVTLGFEGGPLNLNPGQYFFGVEENNENITLATTTDIFTPGKGWVNWDSNPNGGWSNSEAFNFEVAYVLRPNFGDASATSVEDLLEAGVQEMIAFPNPSNGTFTLALELASVDDITISLLDINGKQVFSQVRNNVQSHVEKFDLSTLTAGVYIIRVNTSQGVAHKRVVIE